MLTIVADNNKQRGILFVEKWKVTMIHHVIVKQHQFNHVQVDWGLFFDIETPPPNKKGVASNFLWRYVKVTEAKFLKKAFRNLVVTKEVDN